jgi:hypothetical protein
VCIYGSVDSIGMAFLVGLKLKRERERESTGTESYVLCGACQKENCVCGVGAFGGGN